MTARYRDRLASVGLTYTQYVVLLALWEQSPLPMRDLSTQVHLDSATLSPLLRRMERDGIVTRRRMAEDERVVEVLLTDHGRALREPVGTIQQEVEAATCLEGDDLAGLRRELTVLAARLRDTD